MKNSKIKFIVIPVFLFLLLPSMGYGEAQKEAYYYEQLEGDKVRCLNCPHMCVLSPGQTGICRVRENIDGKLYTHAYSNPCAIHIDPIEKKPLFHFLPENYVLSLAIAGCNFRCKYCQNWSISQKSPDETDNYSFSPEQLVDSADVHNIPIIAYTYSEPSIFYEYMLDMAKIARDRGIKNVWVTNGFLNKEPLLELCKYLDAANVDIKWFTEDLYREMSGGSLEPVLSTCKTLIENNVHLEITNLIVPTLNDDEDMIRELVRWIKENLGPDIPVHFSRFFPMYKLQHLSPTPVQTLQTARQIALDEGLHYVYIGNYPGGDWENTFCPNCGRLLIERRGYTILQNNVINGRCKYCDYEIYGVWE
ncbi:AmmeMemoRadiSam system radical SAM enzyme [candidate division WOR-3 bacterium]|nr:AmmeMemoRadiSam system radical SAM enzyme [candidate division WOR-3 bacterium]